MRSLMTIVALLALPILARADEDQVPLDKIPKPILESINTRFKDAELLHAAKEKENDKTVYEITLKHKGHNIDVTLTPEGDILSIERTIAAKDLPQVVAKVL